MWRTWTYPISNHQFKIERDDQVSKSLNRLFPYSPSDMFAYNKLARVLSQGQTQMLLNLWLTLGHADNVILN